MDVQASGARNMRLAGGRRVRVLDLVRAGLLSEGDELIFERPRSGAIHRALITASGHIELPDGDRFTAPSPAAGAAAGTGAIDGWHAWVVARTRELLNTVRERK